MIKIDKAKVCITERVLREIVKAIDEAKKKIEFTNNPMPNFDMDKNTYLKLKAERGFITVTSPNIPIDFEINLEIDQNKKRIPSGYKLQYSKLGIRNDLNDYCNICINNFHSEFEHPCVICEHNGNAETWDENYENYFKEIKKK